MITRPILAAMVLSSAWLGGCGEMPDLGDAPDDTETITGAFTVGGLIGVKWNATGGATGPLGNPTSNEGTTLFNTGRYNTFEHGRILWKFNTPEAFETHGQIDATYGQFGWEWGMLGFPTTDEIPNGTRRENRFDRGQIYWKSSTGAWPVISSTGFLITSNEHLKAQGKPTLSFTFADDQLGACMKNVTGSGFTPGATISFRLNNPDSSTEFLLKTASSTGTFSFSQSTAGNTCIFHSQLKKINGVATVEARDPQGHRAVCGATTSSGNPYQGTI